MTPEEEQMEKIMMASVVELKEAGFYDLLKAHFRDSLVFEQNPMSLEEILEDYGGALTKEQLKKIKSIFPKKLRKIKL